MENLNSTHSHSQSMLIWYLQYRVANYNIQFGVGKCVERWMERRWRAQIGKSNKRTLAVRRIVASPLCLWMYPCTHIHVSNIVLCKTNQLNQLKSGGKAECNLFSINFSACATHHILIAFDLERFKYARLFKSNPHSSIWYFVYVLIHTNTLFFYVQNNQIYSPIAFLFLWFRVWYFCANSFTGRFSVKNREILQRSQHRVKWCFV